MPSRPDSNPSGSTSDSTSGTAAGAGAVAGAPAGAPPVATARHHAWETLRLAVPVMIARSGTIFMITADVVMTGRFRAVDLGYYGLGFMAHQVLYTVGLGAMMGTTVLAAQADGMGEPRRSGTVWKVALVYAAVLGLLFAGVSLLGEPFFRATGQGAALAAQGGAVMAMFAVGLPALLMYVGTATFLEGISRPRANMWLMVVANLVNVGLNALLIYEHPATALAGIGGMGATGAALATSLTRWLLFFGLAGYVLLMRDANTYGIRDALYYPLDIARKLRRLGLPLMVAQGLESAAFLTITLFAGWLGALQVAVYQIANNLFHITFMLALGIATATSVRVANAVGRLDRRGVAQAGWSGAGLGALLLGLIGLGFQIAPAWLAGLYTADPAAIGVARGVILIAGFFVLVDGMQAVLVGALRGLADIVIPSCMAWGSFWGVAVPLGYWLALPLDWGVSGLISGLSAGATVATVLLLLRFRAMARRDVRPV